MNPERWGQIKQIYHSALELPPGRREEFLKEACAGDQSLLAEVASLFAQQGKSESLFESPAFDAVARALARDEAHNPQQNLAGKTLLHFRIEEKMGEGGMGVVYRARDTRLDRTVALKVLPLEFASDEERMRRFRREAKATSALSHPNVATIYDVGESEGINYIVMEYVEGKTLDELIGRKGMRLNEILKYGVQIADGLTAAHEAGIVHRDLKPANLMVTENGQVKVLDFGLAKLREKEPFAHKESMATEEGTIVGSVAYMSPEQAEGKKVDARSDIFSLGSVLYEMTTGRRAFEGDSKVSTLSAILHREPKAVSSITPAMPADLEKLIGRCLRKDPERRVQHMGDVKLALEELKEEYDSGQLRVAPAAGRRALPVNIIVVAVAAIALIAAGWYWLRRQPPAEPETPLTAVPLTSYPGLEAMPSFSPDGNYVAFTWCKEEGPRTICNIYIKQIGVDPPYQLTSGSGMDFSPAWSPDGRFISFVRELEYKKKQLFLIPQRGGTERLLDTWEEQERSPDYLPRRSQSWTPDSKWLAIPSTASGRLSGLFLLSVETGEKRRLTALRDTEPAFSPDGRILAFTRGSGPRSDIYLLRLGNNYEPQGPPEGIVSTGKPHNFGAVWLPGGDEIVFSAHDCCSATGLWRVTTMKSAKPRQMALPSEVGGFSAISPKGNRLAYVVPKSNTSIWSVDLGGPDRKASIPRKLVSSSGDEFGPAYSPDGKRIGFISDRTGNFELWVCRSDGSNAVQLTSLGGGIGSGPSWSPDCQSLVFGAFTDKDSVIYIISANGGPPRRLIAGLHTITPSPFWSGDGRSIYFRRSEIDTNIWKIPATGGEADQITRNSGDVPQESPDGKFLYYDKPDHYPESCSVWRMPVGGGEETRVLDSVHCLGLYTVWKDGIYFFARPDPRGLIDMRFLDFATGRTKKILTTAQQLLVHIAISPDGRAILYPQIDHEGQYLMLVENFR